MSLINIRRYVPALLDDNILSDSRQLKAKCDGQMLAYFNGNYKEAAKRGFRQVKLYYSSCVLNLASLRFSGWMPRNVRHFRKFYFYKPTLLWCRGSRILLIIFMEWMMAMKEAIYIAGSDTLPNCRWTAVCPQILFTLCICRSRVSSRCNRSCRWNQAVATPFFFVTTLWRCLQTCFKLICRISGQTEFWQMTFWASFGQLEPQ